MKEKIKEALIQFGKQLRKSNVKKEGNFTPINLQADDLIWNNPLAYFFAAILSQSMRAERVWEIPFILKGRLGHLDVHKIANIKDEEIIKVFSQKPKLHRFPKVMALRIKKACRLIIEKYDSKVENIWNDNPRSDDLQRRFEEFDGIGQKKASMATNILVSDFGIKVKNMRGIDISYDTHIRRVFLRSSLTRRDDMNLMIQTARKLNPEYPGILDNPCWIIGRNYCHAKNPDCIKCPISDVCPKLLNIKLPESI